MNKKTFSNYIKSFDFKKLFIDLGWDNYTNEIPLAVDDEVFKISGLVEKRGFVIVLCPSADSGEIPLHTSRKKIENQFSKLHQEHLIIYKNKAKTKQIWQFVIHEKDKPKRVHEIPYNIEQDPEILYQRARGLLFALDEEENITLVDVIARFKEGFGKNTEQVTKRFYDEFKKHHTSFLNFIEGIDDAIKIQDNKNKQWYASLMLSRLMFCYFIQKRGYLDNDLNYLQNKLKKVKQKEGKNRFYGLYRDFLLRLFHQGLGQPQKTRSLTVDIGNIPYLDGGLFDVHVLERQFANIKIKDEAFDRIFNFFDQWNWHLDTNVEATGRDINPDVIGYIFEKYINDRAAMGAYYTKEDITDYIGKNTIIPFLFDKVKREYPKPFKSDGYLWAYLQNSGDTYIYEAVKKGIYEAANGNSPQNIEELTIPENIAIGLDTLKPELLECRKEWNTRTPEEYALPTEIWRETIGRWKRYFEIKDKITSGEITEINDFITYNLNIRQFIQDILENTDDPDLIRHFYKSIHSITILDPTCGSGAFLFAALNILEPLYEACIERMEQFTAEAPRRYKYFHEVLAEVNSEEHPNLRYYIYKTIILNNLYGVDIMHEAVEIAKLRLFLKMVGAVDINLRKPNFGLEPLPDIDFNIRAGNTLVGFATENEFKKTVESKEPLFAPNIIKDFEDEFRITATAFKHFQDAQLITDKGENTHKKAKAELQNRLVNLNEKLNLYLASTYEIDRNKFSDENKFNNKYEKWYSSHQPFHWYSEFYEIINGSGGFDVVIGNPPYVEYSKVKSFYTINNYDTESCGNLYSFVIEAVLLLLKTEGRFGMIMPVSIGSTDRMSKLREAIMNSTKCIYYSNYADRPSCLFSGVHQILTILLFEKMKNESLLFCSSGFIHWLKEERQTLFHKLKYVQSNSTIISNRWGKYENEIEKIIYKKTTNHKKNISSYFRTFGEYIAISGGTGGYWHRSFNKLQDSKKYRNYYIENKDYQLSLCGVINSSVFYWFWRKYSNCRDLTKTDISLFKIDLSLIHLNSLSKLVKTHLEQLEQTKEIREGKMTYEQYRPSKTKSYIDNIDKLITSGFGFTVEELDYIINYDIKYRMGKALFGENDEGDE